MPPLGLPYWQPRKHPGSSAAHNAMGGRAGGINPTANTLAAFGPTTSTKHVSDALNVVKLHYRVV